MKDLPRVFEGKIENKVNNIQEYYYGNDRNILKNEKVNVIQKINNIFSSKNHVYKSKTLIHLKDGTTCEKVIVGKTSRDLITIEGELIKITNIVNIEKI